MKPKYYRMIYGGKLALAFEAEPNEIARLANVFFNLKITNCEPISIGERFAYILTTPELLFKGFILKALMSLQGTRAAKRTIRNGKRVSMLPILAEQKALRQIEQIKEENFLDI